MASFHPHFNVDADGEIALKRDLDGPASQPPRTVMEVLHTTATVRNRGERKDRGRKDPRSGRKETRE